MPTQPVFVNPYTPQLKGTLQNLPPTPGYCIFIDITGSTAMKQQGILKWVAFIHNAFANAHAFLSPFQPLKGIGDALMYYIEEADLKAPTHDPLLIYDGLWKMANEQDPNYPHIKVGVAKCLDAYALTFIANSNDYYGTDIDLTARLLHLAQDKEVVMNELFYQDIMICYNSISNKSQFSSVQQLHGPVPHNLKGISSPTNVYRTK